MNDYLVVLISDHL